MIEHSYLTAPISSYVALINSNGGNNPREEWPADLIACCQDEFMEMMVLIRAWKVIPRNALVGVIDTVRNRILGFVLEIENLAPDAGETEPAKQQIGSDQVSQVFNTYIAGPVQNLAAGSHDFAQIHQTVVKQGNFESLSGHLCGFGVDASDIEQLREAINADAIGPEPFGDRVRGWMTGMLGKAASGAWNVGVGAAGTLLAEALARYFGSG
jgi:hypothetical protein